MCMHSKLLQLCPTLCNPVDYIVARLLCPWGSSSKNTGVGCHAPLQGISLTQESNLCLLHWESGCLPHRKPLCITGTSLKPKQFCCLTNPAYLSVYSWPHYGFWNEVSRQSSLLCYWKPVSELDSGDGSVLAILWWQLLHFIDLLLTRTQIRKRKCCMMAKRNIDFLYRSSYKFCLWMHAWSSRGR